MQSNATTAGGPLSDLRSLRPASGSPLHLVGTRTVVVCCIVSAAATSNEEIISQTASLYLKFTFSKFEFNRNYNYTFQQTEFLIILSRFPTTIFVFIFISKVHLFLKPFFDNI